MQRLSSTTHPPPDASQLNATQSSVAPGGAPSGTPRWADQPDSALWQVLIERDTLLAIGIKAPGTDRGVARGRPTVNRESWLSAIGAIARDSGATVVRADSTHLPVVRVKVKSLSALTRLRRLPFVDYAEPALMRPLFAGGSCNYSESVGSGDASASTGGGASTYGEPLIAIPSSSGAPDYMAAKFQKLYIDYAWAFSTGAGTVLGVTDTGLDTDYPSEFNSSFFASGESVGRWLEYVTLKDHYAPHCSHGTRIAGVATAPRNGRNVVGAAYGANLYAVYQADGELPGAFDAATAIDIAARGGSRTVVMAWGELWWYDQLSNEIDTHYYGNDVMFVGAAGTCPGGNYCPRMETAVFPAEKEEVLAATRATSDGGRPSNNHDFGTKSGVLAYTDVATTGLQTTDIVNLSGSSGATGVVGGGAALVRARYGGMTNRAVMDRLMATSGSACGAPTAWRDRMVNAVAAVGGICNSAASGKGLAGTGEGLVSFYGPDSAPVTITLTATQTSDAQAIEYSWWNRTIGRTTQITIWPGAAGSEYVTAFSVGARDLVTGQMFSRMIRVRVLTGIGDGPCKPGQMC